MALTFGVTNKWVDLGAGDPGPRMTVHGFFRFSGFAGGVEQHILSKWDANNYYILGADIGGADQKAAFIVGDSSNAFNTAKSVTALTTGRWYAIGGTLAGTGATDLKVYLDGINEASTTGKTPHTGGTATNRIGTDVNNNNVGLEGDACECAIWSECLSEDEMRLLSSGVSPLRVRTGKLWGYWPLGDGNPVDFSANGRNGTLQGSPVSAPATPSILPVETRVAVSSSTTFPLLRFFGGQYVQRVVGG